MEVACAPIGMETEMMTLRGTGEAKATELLGRLDLGDESRGEGIKDDPQVSVLCSCQKNTDEQQV